MYMPKYLVIKTPHFLSFCQTNTAIYHWPSCWVYIRAKLAKVHTYILSFGKLYIYRNVYMEDFVVFMQSLCNVM